MRTEFERVHVTAARRFAALLALNHPEVVNAMSAAMIGGALQALDFVAQPDNGFRALVDHRRGPRLLLRRQSRGRAWRRRGDIPSGIAARLDKLYHPLLRKLRDLPMPIVTAVNGPAVGIGMSLALMGDLVVAAPFRLFPAFLRADRTGPGRRLDLASAAADRPGAGARTVVPGREAAGGKGVGMGPDQPRFPRRRAAERGPQAGRNAGPGPDRGARRHAPAVLGEPAQQLRAAARTGAPMPAGGRRNAGFRRRRRRLPAKAAARIPGQIGRTLAERDLRRTALP